MVTRGRSAARPTWTRDERTTQEQVTGDAEGDGVFGLVERRPKEFASERDNRSQEPAPILASRPASGRERFYLQVSMS
jgi:hypothetical protein